MDFNWQKKLVPFAVFFVVANPATFKLTRSLAGSWVAAADGLPTTTGLLLHALVFVIVAHFVWRLVWGKKKSGFGGTASLGHGTLSEQGQYTSSNARGIQGQAMHPADFDDGADCQ
jgi:hypothetical protein